MELQMRLIFFFLMVSSAAEEVNNELKGVVGGSITFPGPVKETGFFILGGNIASVNDRKLKIFREPYKDRLLWNNQTGLFTIRGLKKTDSGVYTVDSVEGTVFTRSYKLTVYEPVAAPVVKALIVSEDDCTFICSVEKTEETTLLWYKDGEILRNSSQALPLSLTVQDFSSAYSCVAANPAENKTVDISVEDFCSLPPKEETQRYNNLIVVPVVLVIVVVLAMFIGLILIKNKKRNVTQDSINGYSEVVYTQTH